MRKIKEIYLDIEYNKDLSIILIGVIVDNYYKYFIKFNDFLDFISKMGDVIIVYVYNIEIDLGVILDDFIEYKFNLELHFNKVNLVGAILRGNYRGKKIKIKFIDVYMHLPLGIKKIGDMLNLHKLEIDYDIKEINKEILEYNKRDIEILKECVNRIKKIYKGLGIKTKYSLGSYTIGGVSYRIWFNMMGYNCNMSEELRDKIRGAYKGGWVEVFNVGEHWAKEDEKFYLIDVNSLYPHIMLTNEFSLPDERVLEIKDIDKDISLLPKDCILEDENGEMMHILDVIRLKVNKNFKKYYRFRLKCRPFDLFIKKLSYYKENDEDVFNKCIYKNLMNSLYGKFGQSRERIILTNNYNDYINDEKVLAIEEYGNKGIYRVLINDKYKSYANIIWAIEITTYARNYMYNFYNKFKEFSEIFYIDTDSFILRISDDNFNKLLPYINNKKIGYFKIVKISDNIKIYGKKMYVIDDMIKVKGVSNTKKEEFLQRGIVIEDKFTKIREGLRRGIKIGKVIKVMKRNKKNMMVNNKII